MATLNLAHSPALDNYMFFGLHVHEYSQFSTNGTSLQQPLFLADSPNIDSSLNLAWDHALHCREKEKKLVWVKKKGKQSEPKGNSYFCCLPFSPTVEPGPRLRLINLSTAATSSVPGGH